MTHERLIKVNKELKFETYEPKWKLYFSDNVVYFSITAPNAFHRMMLKLVLGLRWERIK